MTYTQAFKGVGRMRSFSYCEMWVCESLEVVVVPAGCHHLEWLFVRGFGGQGVEFSPQFEFGIHVSIFGDIECEFFPHEIVFSIMRQLEQFLGHECLHGFN